MKDGDLSAPRLPVTTVPDAPPTLIGIWPPGRVSGEGESARPEAS